MTSPEKITPLLDQVVNTFRVFLRTCNQFLPKTTDIEHEQSEKNKDPQQKT